MVEEADLVDIGHDADAEAHVSSSELPLLDHLVALVSADPGEVVKSLDGQAAASRARRLTRAGGVGESRELAGRLKPSTTSMSQPGTVARAAP
jgi:hypothetical protein